ncbi:MAG: hypothetical protein A2749_02335 [Parcubacteria group bacterium RIFCSPHIGHO2_01_FULL_45_26]|uniref:Uncharacterized protein n=1 Tax=Candidatus Yanofskybacteria bacterium RIFCSPLOWO2_02_FULL_43_10b TaxID=1802704 RepID=A0A1F8H6P4_9BACT|nr:MAG: hypothetical protein A3I92_03055 [Candidatus Yanofskybacteria bacterium RIFCSPLOWO2_02_FULL_43_10b]OHB18124.1 MAG: hypothetical protein A2749_02335 [Parcubacteria group bacterium RIFCSPHIGHO2_01_FULL_45_26]
MSFEKPTEKNKGVQIEYTYKGKYGEILSKGKDDNFDLTVPEGAIEFDGYMRTSYDNFVFQGSIEEAKELLANIKRLEKLTVELQNIENQLLVARSKRKVSPIEDLKRIKEDILKEMDSLEKATNVYKI